MKEISGYSPAHITAFFTIEDSTDNELKKGSRGAGFCLGAGVKTGLSLSSKPGIKINNEYVEDASVSLELIGLWQEMYPRDQEELSRLLIEHHADLPQGSGFGTSGAGALSFGHALNGWFSRGLSREEIAALAHRAELRAGTGLGTIAGEYLGGIELRVGAGAPGHADIRSMNMDEPLRCRVYYSGRIPTAGALADPEVRSAVIEAGKKAVMNLDKLKNWKDLMRAANRFTVETGLLPDKFHKLFDFLTSCSLFPAMLMFGEGIHFLYAASDSEKIDKMLNQKDTLGYIKNWKEIDLPVDPDGGRLLNEF